ncbi:sensor histidine kinase [Paenibacillus faecis]|uniref:histidine kinase n=1 Tax=Paenibacillus faecis TaxID=862114 RepID=A0A5D0CV50_9BACL|nr:sensor histidine kinase [Paenibacillus faecis]TYA13044.1 sensor histidine kinase [Paenibacillus faecis]
MRIWRALKRRIGDFRFQTKIMLSFLLVSMIPVIVLGSFCFAATRSLLVQQSKADLNASLTQSVLAVNNQLDVYNKLMNFLSFNQEIINSANNTYTSEYEMYYQLTHVIDQNFYTARYLNPGVEQIKLYTGSNLPQHGNTVIPIEEISRTPWYPKVIKSVDVLWFARENNLYCARRILSTKHRTPKNNILFARVNYDQLFKNFEPLQAHGAEIIVTDSSGNTVYSSKGANPNNPVSMALPRNEGDYTVLSSAVPLAGWNVYLYKSTRLITKSAWWIALIVLFMITACIAAVVVAGTLFSRRIMLPIHRLHKSMKLIGEGNLDIKVFSSESKDEIGDLIRGFGDMVDNTKALINTVYVGEIARKEAEMKALQAQINPHFLYNSLSIINWRALRIHATDISEMAQLLSTFYRTTLNKGQNLITVSDEIRNVQSYIDIQLIMHSHNFKVDYRIEESLLFCRMPNLMLQPLVENAIIHGIENRGDGGGTLSLSVSKEEQSIVFQVTDNGIGVESERLVYLLQSPSKGYGLKNVHDRAVLMYGEPYGLTIHSVVGEGTQVTLRIPYAT